MLNFLAQDLLVWPEFTPRDGIISATTIISILLVILLVRLYSRRKGRRDASWNILRAHALRRGLDHAEVNVLQGFFRSMGGVDNLLMDPRALHGALRDYFVHAHNISDRVEVRVIDKLFPASGRDVEVTSLDNLRPGEFCGVEFTGVHRLGRLIKTRGEEILVSLTDWNPEAAAEGGDIAIYVFRPRIGGFLVRGKIQRVQKEGLIIHYSDKIESLGERHLMMTVELPIALTEWPPPAPGETAGANADAAVEDDEEEPIVLKGRTVRISDRALTLEFDQASRVPALRELKRRDLWRMEFSLTSEYKIVCRGRVSPVPRSESHYIVRYVDLTENARHALFAEINERGGERENLF